MPGTVEIDPSEWNSEHEVQVSAVDDEDFEGQHESEITHTIASDDAMYADLESDPVVVAIFDNDDASTFDGGLDDGAFLDNLGGEDLGEGTGTGSGDDPNALDDSADQTPGLDSETFLEDIESRTEPGEEETPAARNEDPTEVIESEFDDRPEGNEELVSEGVEELNNPPLWKWALRRVPSLLPLLLLLGLAASILLRDPRRRDN